MGRTGTRKAFLIDLSELTVKGRTIGPSITNGKFTNGGKKYLITKSIELAANFSAGELMTIFCNVTSKEAPPSWAKAGKTKTADKVFKALTESKMTFAKLGSKADGTKPSVSGRFTELIKAGKEKDEALETIRSEFPERMIPDSYYSWYKCKIERETK